MVLSYLLRGFRKYDDLAYEFFWDLDKEKVEKFLGFFCCGRIVCRRGLGCTHVLLFEFDTCILVSKFFLLGWICIYI